MNKVYVLAPVAALMLFGGLYWKHARLHDLRLAELKRQDDETRRLKTAELEASRARAHEQAAAQIAKRNQERGEKERLEEAQRQQRLELEQRRNAASELAHRLRPQIDRLRSELQVLQAAIAREEERARELQQERKFLTEYVARAEANREALYALLQKLTDLEQRTPAKPERSG